MTPPIRPDLPTGIQPAGDPIPTAQGAGGRVAISQQIAALRKEVDAGNLRFTPEPTAGTLPAPAPAAPAPAAPADPAAPAPAPAPAAAAPEVGDPNALVEVSLDNLPEGEEVVRVLLPGRNPGDPAYEHEILVDDPDVARALRQATNEGMRREEFNRRIERVREREDLLSLVDHHIETDAPGFVMSRLPAEDRVQVARVLLTDPAVFQAVRQELEQYEDETQRELARLRFQTQSADRQRDLDATFQQRRERQAAVEVITDTLELITGVIPDPARREMFETDSINELQREYERTRRNTRMTPQEIVTVLKPRLHLYGLSEAQVAQALGGRTPPIPSATPDAAAAARLAADATANSRRLVRASSARRAAAAASTVGTPAQTTGAALPKGQTVKERIDALRDRFGIPKR